MSKLFTMKVTDEQLQLYKAKAAAAELPLGSYIKSLLENSTPRKKRRRYEPVDPKLLRQVAAIGNNLNQVARRLNSGDRFDVLPVLLSIEDQLKELVDAHKVS